MIRTLCPHCRNELQVSPEFSSQTMKCPYCTGLFIAPSAPAIDPHDEEGNAFPKWLVWLCVIAAHFVMIMVLSIVWSPSGAVVFVAFSGLIELAVWQRNQVFALGRQVAETTERLLATTAPNSQRYAPTDVAEDAVVLMSAEKSSPELNDELVEVQAATIPQRRPQTITASVHPRSERRSSMWSHLEGQRLAAQLPEDGVYFYGPGTELNLGRGVVHWPLVYATGKRCRGAFDASLIDGTLPVGPPDAHVDEQLPYWPSYYDCSPAQRSRYLEWLIHGRSDPQIELGYVFIYFYGLERRVVVDQEDHISIAQEVIRLLPIYDHSNSFRNYATSFLWLTLFLASERGDVPPPLLANALAATHRWTDDTLEYCLAIHERKKSPLPVEIAFLVSQHDPRSSSSVIVRRHGDKFRELFAKKYEARFENGMLLKSSKRPKQPQYHPASATLLHDDQWRPRLPRVPGVLKISSQFKSLVEIWEQCIADLKAYNRAQQSTGEQLTAEAYEALPVELRDDDHPEFDTWMSMWEQYADDDGWPLVPISALAAVKQFEHRSRLTKSQCNRILTTADALGIGIEPDARLTGKSYQWDEKVSFFFLASETEDDSSAYNAAAALLRLGLNIAEADGKIDTEELDQITRHLEGQFNLSENQSKRLKQLEYLLLNCQEADASISKVLCKRIGREQRLLVGEFLVGVAASDEVITAREVAALKKAYRSLDLSEAELGKLLDRHSLPETAAGAKPSTAQEFHLDMHAVSRIMTETRQVANILKEAMSAEGDDFDQGEIATATAPQAVAVMPSPPPTSTSGVPESASTLPVRFRPFMQSVIARDQWEHADITAIAKEHGVMLSGAVEAINEWSTEEFGDWLIEEGEPYRIRRELLGESN